MTGLSVKGVIMTRHGHSPEMAGSVQPDNLSGMTTEVSDGYVKTVIRSSSLRSVIASVDDYLMNLGIAEEICSYALH